MFKSPIEDAGIPFESYLGTTKHRCAASSPGDFFTYTRMEKRSSTCFAFGAIFTSLWGAIGDTKVFPTHYFEELVRLTVPNCDCRYSGFRKLDGTTLKKQAVSNQAGMRKCAGRQTTFPLEEETDTVLCCTKQMEEGRTCSVVSPTSIVKAT